MANKTKRVIHAGGIFHNPLLRREGACGSDMTPGTIGFFHKSTAAFMPSSGGADETGIIYVADIDHLRCKGVDDVITEGDWVTAIQPMPGLFLNVRAASGTYKKGQPVSVAGGKIMITADNASAFAYVEEDVTVNAEEGDLIRVVFK